MPTSTVYPFDPTGLLGSNLITNEQHTLASPPQGKEFLTIVPEAAPFFKESMQIVNQFTGDPMVEGVDYFFTHKYWEATLSTGKSVYGSVSFFDPELSAVGVFQYQTVGGGWVLTTQSQVEAIYNSLIDPRVALWSQVVLYPDAFPPTVHDHNIVDMVGMTELIAAISEITAILSQPSTTDYATTVEAIAGLLIDKQMSPFTTKAVIQSYIDDLNISGLLQNSFNSVVPFLIDNNYAKYSQLVSAYTTNATTPSPLTASYGGGIYSVAAVASDVWLEHNGIRLRPAAASFATGPNSFPAYLWLQYKVNVSNVDFADVVDLNDNIEFTYGWSSTKTTPPVEFVNDTEIYGGFPFAYFLDQLTPSTVLSDCISVTGKSGQLLPRTSAVSASTLKLYHGRNYQVTANPTTLDCTTLNSHDWCLVIRRSLAAQTITFSDGGANVVWWDDVNNTYTSSVSGATFDLASHREKSVFFVTRGVDGITVLPLTGGKQDRTAKSFLRALYAATASTAALFSFNGPTPGPLDYRSLINYTGNNPVTYSSPVYNALSFDVMHHGMAVQLATVNNIPAPASYPKYLWVRYSVNASSIDTSVTGSLPTFTTEYGWSDTSTGLPASFVDVPDLYGAFPVAYVPSAGSITDILPHRRDIYEAGGVRMRMVPYNAGGGTTMLQTNMEYLSSASTLDVTGIAAAAGRGCDVYRSPGGSVTFTGTFKYWNREFGTWTTVTASTWTPPAAYDFCAHFEVKCISVGNVVIIPVGAI